MLDQHAKDNCDAAAIPAADTAIEAEKINSTDSEEGGAEAVPANSQFKLDDSDRDNLLNLLTDKEHDESGGGGSKKEEEGGEFKLGSADRDELLNLLEGIEEEREQISSDSEQSDGNNVDGKFLY